MEVLLLATMGAVNILCFLIGAKVGQTVAKGEKVEMPSINPLTLYREHQDKREADKEQSRIEAVMRNIEAYDGTSFGQKEIPR
jgi:hypothetical protein